MNTSALHLLERGDVTGARYMLQILAKVLDEARSPAAPVVDLATARRAKSRNSL